MAELELARILGAKRLIRDIAVPTPLQYSQSLSERTGHEVHLKLETVQTTGAFKIRGAAHAIARLSPERKAAGVVCASTGNHGRAVAYAARRHGIEAIVCLSSLVPANKVAAIEALGATVRRVGNSQDEAMKEVRRLTAEGMSEIPPFDHADVIAGQGTIGIEILEDLPEAATLLIPLSGGGLAGGIALATKTLKPSIRVIGISMQNGAAMHESLKAGRPVEVAEVPSLADSLGGGIGVENRFTFTLCKRYVDETLLLDESEIYRGMRFLLMEERLVAEGAASVGAAALLAGRIENLEGPVVAVLSGRNVDSAQIAALAGNEPIRLGETFVKG
jgi:threonine dehydratase